MTKKEIDNALFGYGVNSTDRFQAFENIAKSLSGKNYWYALRNAYEMSDNLYHKRDWLPEYFNAPQPHQEYLMNAAERKYLAKLPETITIYRGMTIEEFESGNYGLSWTLKKEVADFFAFTYMRNHSTAQLEKTVHQIEIPKTEVIAFFNDRKEFEIIFSDLRGWYEEMHRENQHTQTGN